MATSGDYLFDPTLADSVDEAFDRIGIDPAHIVLRHIQSARRSMSYLMSEWANRGIHQWKVDITTYVLTQGEQSFALPDGTIDILHMSYRRDGVDTVMYPITRQEWLGLHRKTLEGRPDRFFVDRQLGVPTVYLWQLPDRDGDSIVYSRFHEIEDPGKAGNTLDVPFRFQDAFVQGLAWRLSQKYNKAIEVNEYQKYENAMRHALVEDGERAPTRIGVSYNKRHRT